MPAHKKLTKTNARKYDIAAVTRLSIKACSNHPTLHLFTPPFVGVSFTYVEDLIFHARALTYIDVSVLCQASKPMAFNPGTTMAQATYVSTSLISRGSGWGVSPVVCAVMVPNVA